MHNTEDLLAQMGLNPAQCAPQRSQTAHRLRLIDFWAIPPGSRVLEIGCGQGDATAALAYAVGEEGFVHGVDIAPADYGTPETLGEARDRLLASPLGGRLRIDLATDVTADGFDPAGPYDYVVLSHCSWYFASPDMLRALLTRARQLASNLCFAEWDIRMQQPEQLAHFYAANIQAICSCYLPAHDGNIRTLLSPADISCIVLDSGWMIQREDTFCSPDLLDGYWEVEMTGTEYPQLIRAAEGMPDKLRALLLSQIKTMHASTQAMLPLNTFVLAATK